MTVNPCKKGDVVVVTGSKVKPYAKNEGHPDGPPTQWRDFLDYWRGDLAWERLSERRRDAFLRNNCGAAA